MEIAPGYAPGHLDSHASNSPSVANVSNKCCRFTIMDTVEDHVRVRLLNVWAFLLVYIFFVLALLKALPAPPSIGTVIEIGTPLSTDVYTGEFTSWQALPQKSVAKATLFDQHGKALTGVRLTKELLHFTPAGPLPCSTEQVKEQEGTIEAYRYAATCNTSRVEGFVSDASDKDGVAAFPNFKLDGPAGIYTISTVHNHTRVGLPEQTSASTPVHRMYIVDRDTHLPLPAPTRVEVGVPLARQPAVQLLDAHGLPQPGRRITAFANPDPSWPPEGTRRIPVPSWDMRGQKLFELDCATSEPSDDLGFAHFNCLGVRGGTDDHVYFIFTDAGFAFQPWNDFVSSPNTLYPIPVQVYRYPTALITRVNYVETLTPPFVSVEEGSVLDPPPRVRATDRGGNPVAGATCYGIVAMAQGHYLPFYFRRHRLGEIEKELLNASAVTDEQGEATFHGLTISARGNALYTAAIGVPVTTMAIAFVCDGVPQNNTSPWFPNSGGYIEEVSSKVATVKIQRFTSTTGYVTKLHRLDEAPAENIFTAVVRVLDANGNGVEGKTVAIDADSSGRFVALPVMATQETTSPSGFAVVNFGVVIAPPNIKDIGHTDINVRFKVDGVTSELSENLTVRLADEYNPSMCTATLFTAVATVDQATGDMTMFNVFEETPYVMSGSAMFFNLELWGQTMDTCLHYPGLVAGGSANVNMSSCFMAQMTGGRRLSAEEIPALKAATDRRDAPPGPSGTRRLTSADSSVRLEIFDAYSSDGREECDLTGTCDFQVKHQPDDLFTARIKPDVPLPTLAELSARPQGVVSAAVILASQGDRFVRFKATLTPPGGLGPPQMCYSPPLRIQVRNALSWIEIVGDPPANSWAQTTIDPMGTVDVKLRLWAQDPQTLEYQPPSSTPEHHLATDQWTQAGVYWRFVEVPVPFGRDFGMQESKPPLPPNVAMFYRMEEAGGAGQGWNQMEGTLSLTLTFLKEGCFGKFAVQFGAAGLWTRVFTFEVRPPPDLAIEVLDAPGFGASEVPFPTQTFLPQQPRLRVTSAGLPVEGAIVAAEVVLAPGGEHTPIVDVRLYSALGTAYSMPSGLDGVADYCVPSYACLFNLIDGHGCMRFKFTLVADEVESAAVPNEALCFRPAYDFKVRAPQPTSLPVGMQLQHLSGVPPLEVEAHIHGSFPSLLCPATGLQHLCPVPGFNFAMIRAFVVYEAGKHLSAPEARSASQAMLDEAVCIFFQGPNGMAEVLGRCSPPALVQLQPFVIVRFKFLKLTWKHVLHHPAEIKLTFSDLSGSVLSDKVRAPDFFPLLNSSAARAGACTASLLSHKASAQTRTTGVIVAETGAASASVELQPPEVGHVGKMFLVRIKLMTKLGTPARHQPMRVCIASLSDSSPSVAGPAFLEKLSGRGHTLETACTKKSRLAAGGTVRTSRANGVVSFPLTVELAPQGTYVLHFQPQRPGARIMLTSAPFRVFNDISAVNFVSASWGMIKVAKFGEASMLPRKPRFVVEASEGRTLQELWDDGVRTSITLTLRGVSVAQLEAKQRMRERRQQLASTALRMAKNRSEELVSHVQALGTTVAGDMAAKFQEKIASMGGGLFGDFEDTYREACMATSAATLGRGDPSAAAPGEVQVQEPAMADTVRNDPNVIAASERLGSFFRTLTGGGEGMDDAASMLPLLDVELDFHDLEVVEDTSVDGVVYTPKGNLTMTFSEGFLYQFGLKVNGVDAPTDTSSSGSFPPFTVELPPLPVVDLAFLWVSSFGALVLALLVLVSNTRTHHACWFGVAIPATIGVIIMVPFLEEHKNAMGGYWAAIACADLALLLAFLILGLVFECMPRSKNVRTFQERKLAMCDEYATMRIKQLFRRELPTRQSLAQRLLSLVKPASPAFAFYFPSPLLVGGILSLVSFFWALWNTLRIATGFSGSMRAMMNKATKALLGKTSEISMEYEKTFGTALPSAATDFVYNQLAIMNDWFMSLINALEVGLMVGVGVGSVIVLASVLATFHDFRTRALDLRRGVCDFDRSKAVVKRSALFIGLMVSSTVVGFFLVCFLIMVFVLPLQWPLLWQTIWNLLPRMLPIIIPALVNPLLNFVASKLLTGKDVFKHRPLAAAYLFWQSYISIIGGIGSAFVRFVIGLVGLLFMIPTVWGPNTPQLLNKVIVLDSVYMSYVSMVNVYHTHNSPLLVSALHKILNIRAARREAVAAGRKWPKSKSILLLLLMRFPMLRKYRKAFLADMKKHSLLPTKGGATSIAKGSTVAAVTDTGAATHHLSWMRYECSVAKAHIDGQAARLDALHALLTRYERCGDDAALEEFRQQVGTVPPSKPPVAVVEPEGKDDIFDC